MEFKAHRPRLGVWRFVFDLSDTDGRASAAVLSISNTSETRAG